MFGADKGNVFPRIVIASHVKVTLTKTRKVFRSEERAKGGRETDDTRRYTYTSFWKDA